MVFGRPLVVHCMLVSFCIVLNNSEASPRRGIDRKKMKNYVLGLSLQGKHPSHTIVHRGLTEVHLGLYP